MAAPRHPPLSGALPAALLVGALLGSFDLTTANSDITIFNMMMKNYKPETAPDQYGLRSDYIPVQVQAMLEAVDVDDYGSTVTLHCLLRLTWSDIRLRYRSSPSGGGLVVSHATAGMLDTPKLWLPSLRFPRALKVDFDNSMDNFFMIRPNGTLTWQRRIILKLPCELKVNSFPWDTNKCRAAIRQSLDREALMLNWTRSAVRPVYTGPNLSINGFRLTSLSASYRTSAMADDSGASARSKVLVLKITIKRIANYYVVNDIIPTSILVLSSYLTFWLSPQAVTARALVSAFMLLACFIVSAIAGRAAPLVAVLKALDVWNFICLFFLLWAMVQSLVVYHMSRRPRAAAADPVDAETAPPKPPCENGGDDPEAIVADSLPPPPPPGDELGPLPPRPRRSGLTPRLVDLVSRVLYPLAFCVVVITFGVLFS